MRSNLPVTDREVVLSDDVLIVSKTDLKGRITYVNRDFLEVSGFGERELIGEPHNIVRHPDMPPEAFEDLWRTLKEGRPWTGYVKNRCKNGDYYWVLANVTPIWEVGRITGYLSVRRKADADAIARAEDVYRRFREKKQGKLRLRYGQAVSGGGALADLSLAARMGLILGALGLIVALVMIYALIALGQTNREVRELYDHRFEPSRIVGRIGKLMADNRAQIMLGLQHDPASPFLAMHDHPLTQHTDAIALNGSEIDALWTDYQKTIHTDEHRALADAYAAALRHFTQKSLLPAREALLRGEFIEANLILLQKVNPAYVLAAEKADVLYRYHSERARADMAAAQQRYDSAFLTMVAAFAALLAIGLIASLRMIVSIRRPIEAAIATFRNIAQGEYGNAIDIARNDEMGRLNQALQAMQTRMGFEMVESKRIADEMTRIKIALDNVSTGVMIADPGRNIIYANRSVRAILKKAEADIRRRVPDFDADALIGANIDAFHKNPAHQAKLLGELRERHSADIVIGARRMTVTANPVFNEQGERLGSVAEWLDRTDEAAVEREIEAIVHGAAEGDFTRRLALEGKEGFFRNLAVGLNQLLDTASSGLAALAEVLDALARGDLTQTISGEYKGMFGQLMDDANTTVARLREVVGAIKEATETINTATKEIAAGNQNLSARTEEQASSLQETASSMEEINVTVRQNAESARQANALAIASNEAAVRGGQAVEQVVQTMTGIQSSSQKIADIVGVIDSIAFQTNILALNAAVEAARAGEQGRGFAVVASEVRNLAQRSAAAAKEIKALIAESVEKVESGVELVNAAGRTMDEVVGSFRKVASLVTDIAEASREQANGIEQITQAISQMDAVTQQNAALVEEAAAAAESLEDQVSGLVQAVGMFKIAERTSPTNLPGPALRDATPRRLPGGRGGVRSAQDKLRQIPPPHLPGNHEEWEEF